MFNHHSLIGVHYSIFKAGRSNKTGSPIRCVITNRNGIFKEKRNSFMQVSLSILLKIIPLKHNIFF